MKNYSIEIAQAIKEHLEEREIKLVAFDENSGNFGFVIHLHGQITFIHYIISIHEDDYTVTAICPMRPASSNSAALAAMAEFICRANYGLRNGNFEMDFRDGELRYKCFVDCDEHFPSSNVVRDSISVPAAMMKRYGPGIIDVLYNGVDAATAVEKCEENNSMIQELVEAKRALEELLHKRSTSEENESCLENAAVECDDDDDFPSFEEFLRMVASSAESAEGEDADEDACDNENGSSVA